MTSQQPAPLLPHEEPELVTEAGLNALKAIMAANGGAGLALLTFFGSFDKTTASSATLALLGWSMRWFVFGTMATVLAFGLRYFSQASYARQFSPQPSADVHGDRFRVACMLAALAGFVMFGLGGYQASSAIMAPATVKAVQSVPSPRP